MTECDAQGWKLVRNNTFRKTIRNRKGRDISVHVINPERATELYSRIHRKRVGVLQMSDTHIPVAPAPRKGDYVSLSRFVEYKAFFCSIRASIVTRPYAELIEGFQEWIEFVNCEGEGDPRCLPFHIFDADVDRYDLNIPSERQRFESDYRRQSFRRDREGLEWKRPNVRQMHGREVLHVAGRELIRGFHWDVSDSNRAGLKRVGTTSEIWQLWPDGYVNIYPDAKIRSSRRATKIFPGQAKNRGPQGRRK